MADPDVTEHSGRSEAYLEKNSGRANMASAWNASL